MTNAIDRRAAIGAIAGASAMLAAPGLAAAAITDALTPLIAAHRKAYAAFNMAIDELEVAEPKEGERVVGLAECD